MKLGLFFRILVLVGAFLAVIWTMRSLRTPEMQKGIAETFSAATGVVGGQAEKSSAETTLDWCDTRVHELARPGHEPIHQEKLKWMLGSHELDFISVEKWFGRNCRIRVSRRSPQELTNPQPVMVVKFIKGPEEILYRSEQGLFRWRQEIFESAELEKALRDLEEIPTR